MVENLQNRIMFLLNPPEQIPLRNGNYYLYLKSLPTRINRQYFAYAFEYQISSQSKKRVTLNLINSIYQHYIIYDVLPNKADIFAQFPFELSSRPCNYTVAIYFVKKLIADDLNKHLKASIL